METLDQRLAAVRLKVEHLLEQNRQLAEENARLNGAREDMEKTIELQKNTIAELTERNKLIKLAKNLSLTGSDGYDMKIKINEMVKEIDRCIDLLNE